MTQERQEIIPRIISPERYAQEQERRLGRAKSRQRKQQKVQIERERLEAIRYAQAIDWERKYREAEAEFEYDDLDEEGWDRPLLDERTISPSEKFFMRRQQEARSTPDTDVFRAVPYLLPDVAYDERLVTPYERYRYTKQRVKPPKDWWLPPQDTERAKRIQRIKDQAKRIERIAPTLEADAYKLQQAEKAFLMPKSAVQEQEKKRLELEAKIRKDKYKPKYGFLRTVLSQEKLKEVPVREMGKKSPSWKETRRKHKEAKKILKEKGYRWFESWLPTGILKLYKDDKVVDEVVDSINKIYGKGRHKKTTKWKERELTQGNPDWQVSRYNYDYQLQEGDYDVYDINNALKDSKVESLVKQYKTSTYTDWETFNQVFDREIYVRGFNELVQSGALPLPDETIQMLDNVMVSGTPKEYYDIMETAISIDALDVYMKFIAEGDLSNIVMQEMEALR